MGTLFLVATPIGNLEDITLRALRILGEASIIAAEDARLTINMLRHYDIRTPVTAYHAHSPPVRAREIIEALASGDVAVVSDAGTPGISDPGGDLVRLAVEHGYPVIPVPGASSAIAAASVSGAADGGFVFAGFLPRQSGPRRKRLRELAQPGLPIIVYEAPGRVISLLHDVSDTLSDADIIAGREITKIHEEWLRGRADALVRHVTERGEFTLVIVPGDLGISPGKLLALDETLRSAIESGASLRDAVDQAIAATGLPRNQVYERALRIRRKSGKNGQNPS